jgi:hypothetical protein
MPATPTFLEKLKRKLPVKNRPLLSFALVSIGIRITQRLCLGAIAGNLPARYTILVV